MIRVVILVLICVTIALRSAVLAATTARPSDATIDARCRPYFHDACSEAMGRWLPYSEFDVRAWSRAATRIPAPDRFAYGERRRETSLFDAGSPYDGTKFVYGMAGPPTGHAFYDPVHRIAFYHQGCCSWNETVEAIGVASPPKPVARRDLSGLTTAGGVRLWQTPAEVRRIYGSARLQAFPGHPDASVLSYRAPLMFPGERSPHDGCDAYQNFFFRKGHLFAIQFARSC